MPFYKVVLENQENPGTYVSALVSGQARVTYQIDKPAEVPPWLDSKRYYPTAFKDLQAAQDFANAVHLEVDVHKPLIFEAEGDVVDADSMPPRARIFHVVHGLLTTRSDLEWPDGTVMMQSLRLKSTMEVKK
jgi:hypothetical protein